MTLKEAIDKIVDRNRQLNAFLNDEGRDYQNADDLVTRYLDKLEESRFNVVLAADFARVLQLLNKQELYDQFKLSDIWMLFQSLIETEPFNLDYYVEAAHFEWSVMDNKERANQIVNDGIDVGNRKLKELAEWKRRIENNEG